jgi:hypothetical protein
MSVKRIFIFVPAIISAVILVSCNDYFDEMNKQVGLNKGLVAYWPIVGSASYQKDYSGNGNDLNLISVSPYVPTIQSGKFSTAVKFGTYYSYMGYSGTIGTGVPASNEVSVCAWVSVVMDGSIIVSDSFSFSANNTFHLRFNIGASVQYASSVISFDNSWRYVVGTYDGKNVRLYLNGELVSSVPESGIMVPAASSVTLGTGFVGSLDEIRIYNRALGQDEIKELMNMGVE